MDRDAAQAARGDAGLSCEVVSCFSSTGPGSRWSRQHHQVRAVRTRGRSTGLGSAPTRVSGCARPDEQAPPRCQPPADDLRFRHRTFLHCRRWMRRSSLQQVSEHASMATVASWSQRSLRTIRATRSVGAKSANLSADRSATCLAAARTARSGRAHRRHPHDDGYCAQRPASTTTTVLSRIFRSWVSDQLSTSYRSRRRYNSKSASHRPDTCHQRNSLTPGSDGDHLSTDAAAAAQIAEDPAGDQPRPSTTA